MQPKSLTLALCCLSGSWCSAATLPPLQIDPALLGAVPPAAPPAAPPEPAAAAPRAPAAAVPSTAAPPAAAAPAAPAAAAVQPVAPPARLAPAAAAPSASEKPAPAAQAAPAELPAAPARTATARPAVPPAGVAQPLPGPAAPAAAPAAPAAAPAAAPTAALPPLALQSASVAAAPTSRENAPTYVSAERISGHIDEELHLEGAAELRKANATLSADDIVYFPVTDELHARGNVVLQRDADKVTTPELQLQIDRYVGHANQATYEIRREPPPGSLRQAMVARGTAERIDFLGERRVRLANADYSTCRADQRDWYAKVEDLTLDYDREVGEGKSAKVVFKDVPLFYTPWLDFSLNNQRKSGLLAPTFGSSNVVGFDFTLPYYWNIAPNLDATFAPRVMTRRGVMLLGETRYLQPDYHGTLQFGYLPNDAVTDTRRSSYAFNHVQQQGRWNASVSLNGASDGTYFTDFGTHLMSTAQTNLLRQGLLRYEGDDWRANLLLQRYQTLQDPRLPTVVTPYGRLPALSASYVSPTERSFVQFAAEGSFVDFRHPTLVNGRRLVLYPQVSLPLQTSSYFVTPKVGVNYTHYDISDRNPGDPNSITRALPVVSVDSGLVFERDTDWFGRGAVVQTLEPRLYYLYTPHKDQSDIPVFDTAAADFNFAQIFSENRYSGLDRVNDANQLTAAVVSRYIDSTNGAEIVRGAIGQRYYFRDQLVTLPGEAPRTGRVADLLVAISGRLLPKTQVDAGWQYNPHDGHTERASLGVRYQPEPTKVLNASYRFTRRSLRDIDLSGQWKLGGGWYGVGRYNFSVQDGRLVQAIAGAEYDSGCWIGRFVVQRVATASQTYNTAFFVQLELNGFSRVGSNPLDLLKRSIPGYGVINQPVADPVFGSDY
ncbi:MAG: LPS-assembly protein LptD [Rhodocyclaceae bacterium]|nr:LPS-assembly protein LptD [Rhodocyclaceae bacterium]